MKRPNSSQIQFVVRWAVVVLAIASIVVGLALGNQLDVFWKAATICLECIGIA